MGHGDRGDDHEQGGPEHLRRKGVTADDHERQGQASDGSDDSFANGAEVVVVSVVSPTRVRVMAADRFWTTQ